MFRMVGANIEGIYTCPCLCQLFLHMLVQPGHILQAEISPGDTGLVGDDDHQVAAISELFYRLRDTRDKFEILDPEEIVFLLVDRAVPIEKNCRPLRIVILHGIHSTSRREFR